MRELSLSSGLKRDSIFSEFEVYYQPILNTQTQSILCMQALIQWRHPEWGLINQDELHIYAEKNGKANDIFEWLLKQACQQFSQWDAAGFRPELIGVSLSIKQLNNIHFIYRVSQILQECNFNPERLLIEVKENVSLTSFDAIEKIFNILKYLKIQTGIDHFGSGMFSVQDLKKISVNYLKIDQSLVSDIHQNQQTKELMKAMRDTRT